MKILVTGAAGFIGFHVTQALLKRGDTVVGIDNLNDYYSVALKEDRVQQLKQFTDFEFQKIDITQQTELTELFRKHQFERVINLAAQAGVRYSLTNPHVYVDSNVTGFVNILECCRHFKIQHLVYASSSSVYGANTHMPFSVKDNVDHPLSLYAATKKANELMAHSYSHLYRLPTTGLRFFTVYGPWGRPDMAMFLFVKAIDEGRPIQVFNNGQMKRDMTYIDDIVEGVIRTLDRIPEPDPAWNSDHPNPNSSNAPYKLYNIGNNQPVGLMHLIETIEKNVGAVAQKEFLGPQPGDVPETYTDIADLERDIQFKPQTSVEVGVKKFVDWYRDYYRRPQHPR